MSWLVASTRCEAGVSTVLSVTTDGIFLFSCSPLLSVRRCSFNYLACYRLILLFFGISILNNTSKYWCSSNYVMCQYWHIFMIIFTGKNKRVGKQLASQKILQLLHPHVKNWGSLLRMYGRESSKMVKQVNMILFDCNLPCDCVFAFMFFCCWVCLFACFNLVTTKLLCYLFSQNSVVPCHGKSCVRFMSNSQFFWIDSHTLLLPEHKMSAFIDNSNSVNLASSGLKLHNLFNI